MEGWVKLHKKLSSKGFYSKNSEKVHLWIHLLFKASHNTREEILGGKPVVCNAGQFTTGRKQLSIETGISESKIERILTNFEKIEQQIEQQKTSTNRLISICNWLEYQFGEQQIEQQVNNDRTTSEQQVNTPLDIKNKENNKNTNTWRDSFEIYLEELRLEYKKLINDPEFISSQEKFHPNIDIKLSLEKACVNYWATEAGWKKKKSERKTKNINWKSTLTNAIDLNKVYKPRDFSSGQAKQETETQPVLGAW